MRKQELPDRARSEAKTKALKFMARHREESSVRNEDLTAILFS